MNKKQFPTNYTLSSTPIPSIRTQTQTSTPKNATRMTRTLSQNSSTGSIGKSKLGKKKQGIGKEVKGGREKNKENLQVNVSQIQQGKKITENGVQNQLKGLKKIKDKIQKQAAKTQSKVISSIPQQQKQKKPQKNNSKPHTAIPKSQPSKLSKQKPHHAQSHILADKLSEKKPQKKSQKSKQKSASKSIPKKFPTSSSKKSIPTPILSSKSLLTNPKNLFKKFNPHSHTEASLHTITNQQQSQGQGYSQYCCQTEPQIVQMQMEMEKQIGNLDFDAGSSVGSSIGPHVVVHPPIGTSGYGNFHASNSLNFHLTNLSLAPQTPTFTPSAFSFSSVPSMPSFSSIPSISSSPSIPTIPSSSSTPTLMISMFQILSKLLQSQFSTTFHVIHIKTGFHYALKVFQKQKIKQQGLEKQIKTEIKFRMGKVARGMQKLFTFFYDEIYIYYLEQLLISTPPPSSPASPCSPSLQPRSKQKHPESFCSSILRQLLESVQFLHSESFIHRDLRLSCLVHCFGMLKIIDFSWLACIKYRKERDTFCGSYRYVSPEVIEGGCYDEGVDVWGIGIVMYELATGQCPWGNGNGCMGNGMGRGASGMNFPIFLSNQFVDLIGRMLSEKGSRITVQDILRHEWVYKWDSDGLVAKEIWDFWVL